jgi:hypothetical protein
MTRATSRERTGNNGERIPISILGRSHSLQLFRRMPPA